MRTVRQFGGRGGACALLTSFALGFAATPAAAAVEVAVSLPLSGDEAPYGKQVLEGVQLAIDEANAAGAGPGLMLKQYDDRGDDAFAKTVAEQIAASPAALVVGPAFSTNSLAQGPIFAQAGLASLATTCTSDAITRNATTFRVLFKNSDQGEALALYLVRVLGHKRATVIVLDNSYGHTLQDGFRRAADRLGLTADYLLFRTPEEGDVAARKAAGDPSHPPIVLLALDGNAARLLTVLRRNGATGPFLGGDSLGDEVLAARMVDEPEERGHRGYFTEGLLAISPMILDSANAETLAFAERFRGRFGHDPTWSTVAGYDAAHLAADALRTVLGARGQAGDTAATRASVLAYLKSLDSPRQAAAGLLGPFWFDAERGRPQAIRIGRFNEGRFESAPLQLIPVSSPNSSEIASGEVFEGAPGHFMRLQRVVYTVLFLNELPRVDLAQASFGADFYVWLRFARDAGPNASDPAELLFPTMLSGTFDRARPAEESEIEDGTVYRLWRVNGTFRNDYDLHRYPFDRQKLGLSFFNARAAADRIVYVLDRRTAPNDGVTLAPKAAPGPIAAQAGAPVHAAAGSIAAAAAFRNLTQWLPLDAHERRDDLVTDSSLGDPRRVGVEGHRELSGFQVSVDIQRRAMATLTKNLMPLLLMTVIMFASLYFPHGLVKEKITVAITGALSGAVLLSSINSQLGGVGYTVAVEYAFYVFFGLSTLCIVSVLGAERLRVAGRVPLALRTESWTRVVFLLAVAAIVAGAIAVGAWSA